MREFYPLILVALVSLAIGGAWAQHFVQNKWTKWGYLIADTAAKGFGAFLLFGILNDLNLFGQAFTELANVVGQVYMMLMMMGAGN